MLLRSLGFICSEQGESIEEPWECVLFAADQEPANLNDGDSTREVIQLAVKRRKTTKKRDHIAKVEHYASYASSCLYKYTIHPMLTSNFHYSFLHIFTRLPCGGRETHLWRASG
jgi:hypothetical protein